MSADMMLVCREEGSTYDGTKTQDAVFVTETSMGFPHDAIGDYLQRCYCGEPSTMEQIEGVKRDKPYDTEIENDDVLLVKAMLDSKLSRHKDMNEASVIDFFNNHIGKAINIERW